jgi:glycosyltransferase involved in cell wall biosynthesis
MQPLERAFRAASPRFASTSTPVLGLAFSTAIAVFWIVAFYAAFHAQGLTAWAIGVAFIAYDCALALFVLFEARRLWRIGPEPAAGKQTLSVIVAAYNEAGALAATIDALLGQNEPPERIWLADDGSQDASAQTLWTRYRLRPPPLGWASAASPIAPALRWLRLPHQGKAHALNAALTQVDTDIVVTVDADTLLDPDALAALRHAFGVDPDLVVGGGILAPRCEGGLTARLLEAFQRIEYVRNFLGRHAWTGCNALVLVSGAFAAFKTSALKSVGGFDAESLVEDYELIHRLHRYGLDRGLHWRVDIVGGAYASTDAPATVPSFLRQRRRWFAGFLQTHYSYRSMIGAPRYGALGLAMLPVKTLDAAQPIYGLAAFALLIGFALSGRPGAALPAGALALAKIGFDFVNLAVLTECYRRWTGARGARKLGLAWGCLLVEPFSFQVLRHVGACWGWISFLAGRLDWGRASRAQSLEKTHEEAEEDGGVNSLLEAARSPLESDVVRR